MTSSCVVPPVVQAGDAPLAATTRRAVCAVTLGGWLLAAPLLAAGEPSAVLAAGVAGVAGVVGAAGVAAPGASPGEGEAFAERLAAIQLDLAVDRDLDVAEQALAALLVDAMAAAPWDGDASLLAEVQVTRAELQLQRGDPERAAAILRGEQAPAGGSTQTWQAALADPRVIALATSVEALLARGASALDDEFLEVVRTAVQRKDEKVLTDLGSRAVPYLVALIDPGATSSLPEKQDPLHWLALADASAFERTARELLESGSLVRPTRLAWPMYWLEWGPEAWIVSSGRPARLRSADRAYLLTALLGDTAVLGDDQARQALQKILGLCLRWDGLPEPAAEALGRACLHLSEGTALSYLDAGGTARPLESFRVTWERALTHSVDAVRLLAATWLTAWPGNQALLTRVDDSSPRVRLEVARSLTTRFGFVLQYQATVVKAVAAELRPTLGPAQLAVLATLAADTDVAVRHMAATALVEPVAHDGVPDAVYLALARDPEVSVRQLLTGVMHPDPALTRQVLELLAADEDALVRVAVIQRDDLPAPLLAELLTTLARDDEALVREAVARRVAGQQPATLDGAVVRGLADDADPRVRAALAPLHHVDRAVERDVLARLARDADGAVLEALDERIERTLSSDEWTTDPEAWIALVTARRDHPTRPLVAEGKPLRRDRLPNEFLKHPAGIVASTRWALASGDPGDWAMARWWMRSLDHVSDKGGESFYRAAFAVLDDDELAGALAFYQREGLEGEPWLLEHLVEHAAERVGLLQTLFSDDGQGLGVRLMAGAGVVAARPESAADVARVALEWLGQRTPESRAPSPLERSGLRALLKQLPPKQAASFTTSGLALPSLDFGMLYELAISGRRLEEPTYVEAYLRRFAPLHFETQLTRDVLRALANHRGLMPEGWLESFIQDPEQPREHVVAAVTVIGTRRDPKDIPFLARAVRAEWQPLQWDRGPLVEAACDALVAQLSDEAAEVLLAAAATAPTDKERTLLMDGVRAIQEYQDARALWERRLATGATREDSIAALVRLTGQGSSDQRVQAVRGLATLRAVDQLPLLIELLGDDEAAVVAAARAALDSLNSAPVSATDG